jgi:hypothetical protein
MINSVTTTTVTVKEGQTVSLTCSVTGGNPAVTTVSLKGPSLSVTATSTQPHSLGAATCDMTGQYTCTADNGFGVATGTTALDVKCETCHSNFRILRHLFLQCKA